MDLLEGDFLQKMSEVSPRSVSMILTDLPYGCTKNPWDVLIPMAPMWEQYKRVLKRNGVVVLFGQGVFSAKLILSNEKMYRYSLVWDKVLTSGFLNANKMPLRSHEDILVFYDQLPNYTPQKIKGRKNHARGNQNKNGSGSNYGNVEIVCNSEHLGDMKHPKSILTFQKPHPSKNLHPTEKSIELLEFLIRSYTTEGDVVLDSCMGSGSAGVACVSTNRHFIGIEKNHEQFEATYQRLIGPQKTDLELSIYSCIFIV